MVSDCIFILLQMSSGQIDPFSAMKLEITWQPTVPCRVDTEFVVTFDDPLSSNVNTNIIAFIDLMEF